MSTYGRKYLRGKAVQFDCTINSTLTALYQILELILVNSQKTPPPPPAPTEMAAQSLDQAQNQALRFASALRWERGARKEVEDNAEKLSKELDNARTLNKTLTSELQATSSLLRGAAQTAELLQQQKDAVARLEKKLQWQEKQCEALRTQLSEATSCRSSGQLDDEMQKQRAANEQLKAVNAKLRTTIGTLSRGTSYNSPSAHTGSPHLVVKSPFSDSPGRLLMENEERPAPRAVLFGEPDGSEPDPYDLITPATRDDATATRRPLGALNANVASNNIHGMSGKKAARPSPRSQCASDYGGVACASCEGTLQVDDAGNLQCFDCQDDQHDIYTADVVEQDGEYWENEVNRPHDSRVVLQPPFELQPRAPLLLWFPPAPIAPLDDAHAGCRAGCAAAAHPRARRRSDRPKRGGLELQAQAGRRAHAVLLPERNLRARARPEDHERCVASDSCRPLFPCRFGPDILPNLLPRRHFANFQSVSKFSAVVLLCRCARHPSPVDRAQGRAIPRRVTRRRPRAAAGFWRGSFASTLPSLVPPSTSSSLAGARNACAAHRM